MKNLQRGFVVSLILTIIALILIGGGVYVYMQNKQMNQPTPATQTAQTDVQQSQVTQVVAPKINTTTEVEKQALSAAEKLSIDNGIKKLVVDSRTQAEMYYGVTNGNSYASVCTNINGLLGTRNELSKLSDSVVCKDSSTAWAISAQLTNSTPQYQCADNLGSLIIRSSPITTTKCN